MLSAIGRVQGLLGYSTYCSVQLGQFSDRFQWMSNSVTMWTFQFVGKGKTHYLELTEERDEDSRKVE